MMVGSLRRGSPGQKFYRGPRPGANPSFVPRPNDFKIDPVTGFVKDSHGLSVFDNAASVSFKGFDPPDRYEFNARYFASYSARW